MALSVTELRIGNLINDNREVTGITEGTVYVKRGRKMIVSYRGSQLNPIPLTDQWFKDFGFKQDETKRIWGKDGIVLIRKLKRLPFCLPGYDNSICKYVHQLQNLYFALTGNELNYETKRQNNKMLH